MRKILHKCKDEYIFSDNNGSTNLCILTLSSACELNEKIF